MKIGFNVKKIYENLEGREMTEEEILKQMLTKCHEAGFKPTLNATRIAKSKKIIYKNNKIS